MRRKTSNSHCFFRNIFTYLLLPTVLAHCSASIHPSGTPLPSHTMVSQEREMSNGWPLGLENMNTRLRVMDNSQAATAQPYSIHLPSTSFSSFSSSNLDTMSTASFFQDHSVSLGRLIGIRPGERGALYFPNKIRYEEEHEKRSCLRGERSDMVSREDRNWRHHKACAYLCCLAFYIR